jgi:hypothetical protein
MAAYARRPACGSRILCAWRRNDPRTVVVDPHARYFGAELGERSLIPAADARLGEVRLQEWLNQPALQR